MPPASGVYRFTALKSGCYVRCSSPLLFLMRNWRPGVSGSLRIGALHGADCLCCRAGLTPGLVALGMMNLVWMLTAALVIFAERTISGNHRIAKPLGVLALGVLRGQPLLRGGQSDAGAVLRRADRRTPARGPAKDLRRAGGRLAGGPLTVAR